MILFIIYINLAVKYIYLQNKFIVSEREVLRKAGEWEGEQRQEEEGITSLKRTLVFEMFASLRSWLYKAVQLVFKVFDNIPSEI